MRGARAIRYTLANKSMQDGFENMVFCPHCGKVVSEEDSFCHSCGKTLQKPTVPKPASQAPSVKEVEQEQSTLIKYVGVGEMVYGSANRKRNPSYCPSWVLFRLD